MIIEGLPLRTRLAPAPMNPPKFSTTVKSRSGMEITIADPKATRALVALMNMHAVIGGAACHWGGPAALAEIMAALHTIMFQVGPDWFDEYNFINDVGHAENGLYALRANLGYDDLTFEDLRSFRSIESKLTGHGESHLNPEQILLSNGPLGSAVPQAQGMCMGDKVLNRNRTTICVMSDGASMEGEAKESFSAIPGLALKGKMNPFLLIISDNNTKLSGRIDEGAYDMSPSFESMSSLGWNLIKLSDGHDLEKVYQKIEEAIEEAKNHPSKPVCLWIKTIKGKGVEATEKSSSGGHGFPLKKHSEELIEFLNEIYEGQAPVEFTDWAKELTKSPQAATTQESKIKKEKVQAGFARALIRAAQEELPVFSITADLQGSTGVADFQKEYPQNYIDVGVAESNMISAAAGCAKAGLIPIVDTFAQFGVTKGNLPLTMAALSQAPVIGVFSHTGYQDAADGASHQATTYFAAVSSIPHTVVINCCSSKEAEEFMYQAIQKYSNDRSIGKDGETYLFFVGRENFPKSLHENSPYEWGTAEVVYDHERADVVFVASGPMVHKAIKAHHKFLDMGINSIVVNNRFVNRPDVETISKCLSRAGGNLITLDDHQLIGGMGAQLVHALKLAGHEFRVKSLAMNGTFGRSAYKADQLYKDIELSTAGLLKAYKSFHE